MTHDTCSEPVKLSLAFAFAFQEQQHAASRNLVRARFDMGSWLTPSYPDGPFCTFLVALFIPRLRKCGCDFSG